MTDRTKETYDVVVAGGGSAGLSGALTLARARRSVLVIDEGQPRNAPAAGVHGFLSREGISPTELLRIGRDDVRGYGGQIEPGAISAARRDGDGFVVTLADGREIGARRLLVATGLVDELPDIPGLAERWGRDVLHCPYCHGWEVQDQALGILGTGPMAVHQALMFRQWSADITLFLHTGPEPTPEEAEQLAARGIDVVREKVEAVEVADDRITGVRLRDGRVIARQALVVMPRFTARSGLLASLGVEPSPHPRGVGEHIEADPTGLTSVPGVWVAGNVTDLMAWVTASLAAGVMAGASINADLIAEDTRKAVEAHRVPAHA
jgi:thioredoxin reductase